MYDIDIYNNSMEVIKRKEEKIYVKFLIFLLILIIFLIIICSVKYKKEYHFEGYVNNNKIFVYLKKDELVHLEYDYLMINGKKILYDVESITELDYDINLEKYYLVRIAVKDKLIENNIVNFYIEGGTTNLYVDFVKKIWKGFG